MGDSDSRGRVRASWASESEGEEGDQAGPSGDKQGGKHSRRAAERVNQIGVQAPRAPLPQAVFGAKTGAE